jgi:hypothetical protein
VDTHGLLSRSPRGIAALELLSSKLGKWEVAIFLFASMCGWKNTSAAEIIGVIATNSERTMYAVEIRNGLKCASNNRAII